MTGRELIIYILEHNLEDEEFLAFSDALGLAGYATVEATAAKFNVGAATVEIWCEQDLLPCVTVFGRVYILESAEDPRKKDEENGK